MDKRMTYKKLLQKVDSGDAIINAWSNDEPVCADVTFYVANGTSRRQHVEVTGLPLERQGGTHA